jgi:hypothetical protein
MSFHRYSADSSPKTDRLVSFSQKAEKENKMKEKRG